MAKKKSKKSQAPRLTMATIVATASEFGAKSEAARVKRNKRKKTWKQDFRATAR